MSPTGRWVPSCVLAAILAAVLGGCTHSSAVFPYPRDAVWQVAIGECIIWRPELIDDRNLIIKSTRFGMGGVELKYELKVIEEPSWTATPRTRVDVRMEQIQPQTRRFIQEEKILLGRIGASLEAMAPLPRP